MKASDMAVLAATQEPSTWHGDGVHSVAVLYSTAFELFFVGNAVLYSAANDYGTPEDAAAALDAAWQAEDNRRRQANRTARLDSLAQAAGFDTWRRLETAALAGECAIVAR